MPVAHLNCRSCYTFLDGASPPDSLVERAAALEVSALALTDKDSLLGSVRFADACRRVGIRPIHGVSLTVTVDDGDSGGGEEPPPTTHQLTLLAENRTGYASLCRLVTLAHECGGRLSPCLPLHLLEGRTEGVLCLTGCSRSGPLAERVRAHRYREAEAVARLLLGLFGGDRLFIELVDDLSPQSRRVCQDLADLADRLGLPVVATNGVRHADAEGFVTHDLLACIGAAVTTRTAHVSRPLNRERYVKSAREMADLFGWRPDAVRNTLAIAERCAADALPLGDNLTPRWRASGDADTDADDRLRCLAYDGARARYPLGGSGVPAPHEVRARLDRELCVIAEMGFADYMLLCHEVAAWARGQGIRCAGRGSATDSLVAYCLGLSEVEPLSRNLPFERFLHRGKRGPDVDLDLPNDRRDDVFRHLQRTHGADRVALVGAFHTFWAKGAVRDVGKALGLPAEALSFLSRHLSHFVRADEIDAAFEGLPELRAYEHLRDRFALLFSLCERVAGFPRHLSSHPSGVVIARAPLTDYGPLIPSAKGVLPIWAVGDMEDAERMGALKHDLIALGILSAVSDAEKNIQATTDPAFRYDDIPLADEETFALLRRGQNVGLFGFGSAAQIDLSRKSPPQDQKDLEANMALIRPGPIRGDVVGRFVARRNGWEDVSFLHPALEPILRETWGLVVYQEQVDQVVAAMTGCGLTDAEKFRKGLARHDRLGTMEEARAEFLARACAFHPDLSEDAARAVFHEIEGWSGYGFMHGHAAAFALHGYRTAFLSAHHAAEFFAGLLSNLPLGWWPPNSLAAEARRRGATVLGVDINASAVKSRADVDGRLRLGLNLVSDLGADAAAAIEAERAAHGPYRSLLDLCARVPLTRDRAESLVLAGALDALHPNARRGLLLRMDETLGLADVLRRERCAEAGVLLLHGAGEPPTPCAAGVPEFGEWDRLLSEWTVTGVCAPCHPVAPFRRRLRAHGVLTAAEAMRQRQSAPVRVAGLIVRPHRPPTRSGRRVLFTDIEDESGTVQCVCGDEATQEKCSATLLLSGAAVVEGVVQRRGRSVSLAVESARPLRLWGR